MAHALCTGDILWDLVLLSLPITSSLLVTMYLLIYSGTVYVLTPKPCQSLVRYHNPRAGVFIPEVLYIRYYS